jgi:hypothetical protein
MEQNRKPRNRVTQICPEDCGKDQKQFNGKEATLPTNGATATEKTSHLLETHTCEPHIRHRTNIKNTCKELSKLNNKNQTILFKHGQKM